MSLPSGTRRGLVTAGTCWHSAIPKPPPTSQRHTATQRSWHSAEGWCVPTRITRQVAYLHYYKADAVVPASSGIDTRACAAYSLGDVPTWSLAQSRRRRRNAGWRSLQEPKLRGLGKEICAFLKQQEDKRFVKRHRISLSQCVVRSDLHARTVAMLTSWRTDLQRAPTF